MKFRDTPKVNVMACGFTFLLIMWVTVSLCWSGRVWAEEAADVTFTSPSAVAAYNRYLFLLDQAKKQMVAEMKVALRESMQAGQLEEANRISKLVDKQGESTDESLVSGHGRSAQTFFKATTQRATLEYVGALKGALQLSLRSNQLEESNRISAEIKRMEVGGARQVDKTGSPEDVIGIRWAAPSTVIRTAMSTRTGVTFVEESPDHLSFKGGEFEGKKAETWRFDLTEGRLSKVTIVIANREGKNANGYFDDQIDAAIRDRLTKRHGKSEENQEYDQHTSLWKFPSA